MRFSKEMYLSMLVFAGLFSGCFGHEASKPDVLSVQSERSKAVIVRRSRVVQPVDPLVEEQGELENYTTKSRPEKVKMRLGSGVVGYLVRLSDYQVFVTHDCYQFGVFDEETGQMIRTDFVQSLMEEMADWRLSTTDDKELLAEVCEAFISTEEQPYACLYGSWTNPMDDSGLVPVIHSSGLVESQECNQQNGLMFVKDGGVAEKHERL